MWPPPRGAPVADRAPDGQGRRLRLCGRGRLDPGPHQEARAQTPTVATAAVPPRQTDTTAGATPLIIAGTTGTRREHMTFKDLRIKMPIRLANTRGEIGIPFGMRPNDIVTEAMVTLRAAWSPAVGRCVADGRAAQRRSGADHS
jgi:cellulose synthase (UDP-forming)